MYKAIFFDVDDTLLNFQTSSHAAFIKACSTMNLTYEDRIFNLFTEIDAALWTEQKKNRLTVQQVVDTRFQQLFTQLSLPYSASEMNYIYLGNLANEYALEPAVMEVMQYLAPKYQLYVASNGFLSMQQSRLKLASLSGYFADLYVSNDIGFEKPDQRFFQEMLKRSKLGSKEVLFVGDSLEADMAGASNYNIATCWYNPSNRQGIAGVSPNYTIQNLSQLMTIV
ncbi:2-haloacid dehalogenase/putative hydrolase of the HAD superfamily [Chitinophaga skermanii]|uniref:2-haloacid dehalogenase/putative hydrolase of the HAD superfamily n=1 Tax=Chitinophaga skermanii TaxID=331697 RepID=A0A327Q9F0_9BACT|nr:YjjG family noncanonical pyrimidine nucleotidase [Chitinophaga skermanii]RAJ00438.1 2-haloacid dehalogenase/putative hydrolase of the HAD superfamily [Chitinophaga skermanii]